MNEPKPAYFDLARSWADERDIASARSRRIAWTIATVAVSIALLEAVALALAMPLKTVVPVGVLVDRTTGHVERVNLDQMETLTADVALQEALLAQYVTTRESYDPITVRQAYRKVALWSARQARASYISEMGQNSPATKIASGGRSIGLEATISSVSMLGPDSAMVRFNVAQIRRDGRREGARPYVATMKFAFRGEPMELEDRLNNPLGFQVLSYRVSAEAPPPPTPVLPAPAAIRSEGAAYQATPANAPQIMRSEP
ncbi:type IV secretion system protein [Blastomonas sp. AAP53]|uniref:virB8 family protein n=1 Tax=Blastomonas sp. AAP53 TaxID=1248760 RepID=UPI0002F27D22|nr:type IV secretion system protein [Blastomonas sp. AAP53]